MSNIAALPSLSHKLVSVVCSRGRGLVGSSINSPALNHNHDNYYVTSKYMYIKKCTTFQHTKTDINMRKFAGSVNNLLKKKIPTSFLFIIFFQRLLIES